MKGYAKKGIWFVFVILVTLVFTFSPAMAEAEELKVTVICTERVSVGGRVTIDLEIFNPGWQSVQIHNSAAVAGYPGATFLGPYTLPLSRTIAPHETITVSDYADYNIPTDIPSGTLIGHGVCLFGSSFNEYLGCGGALTEVRNP